MGTPDVERIIEFLDREIEGSQEDKLTPAEANRLLEEAGLLADDPKRPGTPLRKLLREGALPHAYKEGGNWFIPLSKKEETEVLTAETVEMKREVKMETPKTESPEVPKALRMQILLRLLYTVAFLVVFEILKLIVQVTVIGQYIFLLVTGTHNDALRSFGNKIAALSYKVLRYVTLNENARPFPFGELPEEMDAPEKEIRFE